METAVLVAVAAGVFALVTKIVELLMPAKLKRQAEAEAWMLQALEKYQVSMKADIDQYKKETADARQQALANERALIDLERKYVRVQTELDMLKLHLAERNINIPNLSVVK